MLELKDAVLVVEGRQVLPKVSLIACDGQITCISGAHGSGKTLLARVMLGFQPLAEGFVTIDGELLTPLSAPVFRQMMVYIPQAVEKVNPDFVPDTSDLESVWGYEELTSSNAQLLSPYAPEFASRRPATAKTLVIADDPVPSLLSMLQEEAEAGRTVIVMSQLSEFTSIAHQLITLEPL